MENLIFSLNATVPIFFLMLLGLFFNKLGWIDDILAEMLGDELLEDDVWD